MSNRYQLGLFAAALCVACTSARGTNLLTNGDFSLGNSGFTSDWMNSSDLFPEGRYAVGTDPHLYHPLGASFGDHTTGSGLMMIINPGTSGGMTSWGSVLTVAPATTYQFTFWSASWGRPENSPPFDPSPAVLFATFNGAAVGSPVALPAADGAWTQLSFAWNSGASTSLDLRVLDQNLASFGNDFVLDDMSLAPVPSPGCAAVLGVAGALGSMRRSRLRQGEVL